MDVPIFTIFILLDMTYYPIVDPNIDDFTNKVPLFTDVCFANILHIKKKT